MSSHSTCRDLEALLSAYVDHEATPDEMALVESHALSCTACAARLRTYQTLSPRLEADIRAMLLKAEVAAAQVKPARFRGPPARVAIFSPPPGRLFSRVATLAFVLAMVLAMVVVLGRTAPAPPAPMLDTGAQPSVPPAGSTPSPPAPVLLVSIEGVVDPAVASYMHRAVSAAEDRHASALVIVLDASGGMHDPTLEVAQALAGSAVPTLGFLGPGQTTDATDTTLAQSIGLVATATNSDLNAFLGGVDGQVVRTGSGPLTLTTAGARIDRLEMDQWEALVHRLLDPTTAYLLFVLGLYAVFVEVAHPGSIVPGATGVVCLTLASVALAMLPTNWFGVAVLVAAVGLMALELKAATHGVLVLAGVVCLVFGSAVLYSSPGHTEIAIAPGVLIGAAVIGLIGGLLLARIGRQIHAMPPVLSPGVLIGARGTSRSDLDPAGVVHVGGQLWSARLRGGHLEANQPIRVVARNGLVLEVESATLGAATRKGTLS